MFALSEAVAKVRMALPLQLTNLLVLSSSKGGKREVMDGDLNRISSEKQRALIQRTGVCHFLCVPDSCRHGLDTAKRAFFLQRHLGNAVQSTNATTCPGEVRNPLMMH